MESLGDNWAALVVIAVTMLNTIISATTRTAVAELKVEVVDRIARARQEIREEVSGEIVKCRTNNRELYLARQKGNNHGTG